MPIYCAIALPFLLWLILWLGMPTGPYNMDPCGKGTFFPHLILYSVFAYVQVTLGFVGAAWAWNHGAKGPAGLLLFAAAYALLFAGLLTYFYEAFMTVSYPDVSAGVVHAVMGGRATLPGKSNYTVGKYSVIFALGFSSVLLLLAGAMQTAVQVAR
jgi:hypothetical protein